MAHLTVDHLTVDQPSVDPQPSGLAPSGLSPNKLDRMANARVGLVASKMAPVAIRIVTAPSKLARSGNRNAGDQTSHPVAGQVFLAGGFPLPASPAPVFAGQAGHLPQLGRREVLSKSTASLLKSMPSWTEFCVSLTTVAAILGDLRLKRVRAFPSDRRFSSEALNGDPSSRSHGVAPVAMICVTACHPGCRTAVRECVPRLIDRESVTGSAAADQHPIASKCVANVDLRKRVVSGDVRKRVVSGDVRKRVVSGDVRKRVVSGSYGKTARGRTARD